MNEPKADVLANLRELRTWMWKQAMYNRAEEQRFAECLPNSRDPGATSASQVRHQMLADMQIRWVQALNSFFPLGDTAGKDCAKAPDAQPGSTLPSIADDIIREAATHGLLLRRQGTRMPNAKSEFSWGPWQRCSIDQFKRSRGLQSWQTRAVIDERSMGPVQRSWYPTADAINELPEHVRKYIMELETREDPAGTIRELVQAKETIAGLEAMLIEKPTCGILAGEPEIIGERCADGGKCHHSCTSICWRRDGDFVPLAASGLSDNWAAPSHTVDPGVAWAQGCEAGDAYRTAIERGLTHARPRNPYGVAAPRLDPASTTVGEECDHKGKSTWTADMRTGTCGKCDAMLIGQPDGSVIAYYTDAAGRPIPTPKERAMPYVAWPLSLLSAEVSRMLSALAAKMGPGMELDVRALRKEN